jgi:hypothetical protein
MPQYRVHKMDGDSIVGLAGAFTCDTGQAAIEKAAQMCNRRDLEVWHASSLRCSRTSE